MFDTSDGPVIPDRTSARTSSSPSKGEGRRLSLPATAFHRNERRQDSNRVHVKPASTEVISSLIETLSAISSPVKQHFDSLPNIAVSQSTPVSPHPWQTEYPMIAEPTVSNIPNSSSSSRLRPSIDKSARKRPQGVDASYLLHPDYAPIGTSSPKRSPRDKSSPFVIREPEDSYDLGEIYSFGNVSIEPKPWLSTTSINSTGSDAPRSVKSVRSMRSLKSLGFKSSRDSLRSNDEKVVHKAKRGRERNPERLVVEDGTPPQSSPLDQLAVSKRAARGSVVMETPDVPNRASSAQSADSPRRLYGNAEDISGGQTDIKALHNIVNQDYIPTRESSKRHSLRMSSIHRKRRSRLSEHSGALEARDASIEKNQDTLHEALQKVADGTEPEIQPEPAEDLVTRRIKELKDQKMQRDRSSVDTPTEFLSAPETPDRSLSPSPLPTSPWPVVARIPEAEQEPAGAESARVSVSGDAKNSAPSPTIASTTNRESLNANKTVDSRSPSAIADNESKRRSFTAPQRSNSRLLRRLSRPTSPTATRRHTRAFSNTLNQPSRVTQYFSEIGDGDSIDDAVERFLSSPRLSQTIRNSQTGRVIAFSEVGDPKGSVVFCCVGMGLTRFLTAFYDELALTLRLRLITPDRPGVGSSEPHADGLDTPLGWPDDVRAICEQLKITKFSIMAHSAGAIYALATALRMSQHIRCRVHLLAPWIPPSQMSVIGARREHLPATTLPYSQRILTWLPTTFLRAANSNFLSTTSASISTSLPKSPRRSKRRNSRSATPVPEPERAVTDRPHDTSTSPKFRRSEIDPDQAKENKPTLITRATNGSLTTAKERSSNYETRLTEAIWETATTGTNPAVDLLVCLERRQPIGFRYVDITRAVVIQHGSKDTRVPVENVKWLGKTMRRCEVRVLEGEGHGLMASAAVMGNVLMEMASEWDDWNRIVGKKPGMERRVTNAV